jgi:D-glycero-D-manno-heptose 1,7-bisphosphate phosphatase
VVIISNQSGLNRGLIRWSDFWFMHQQMVRFIREAGGDLLAAFYCPHRPDESCGCRKPSPSLLLSASQLFQVLPESTVFVGDRITDIQAAVAAGSKPVLLERSPLGEPAWSDFGIPDPPKRIKSLQEVESLFVGSFSMV